jgi:hypothetical protein
MKAVDIIINRSDHINEHGKMIYFFISINQYNRIGYVSIITAY